MMNRMAKKAPPATAAVAPRANSTRQPSAIVRLAIKRPPRGNAEAAVGYSRVGGLEHIPQREQGGWSSQRPSLARLACVHW